MIGADTNNYVQQPIRQSTSSDGISCYELCAKSIRREHKSWGSIDNQNLYSSNKGDRQGSCQIGYFISNAKYIIENF